MEIQSCSQTRFGLIDILDKVANYGGALNARLEDAGKWLIDGARFAGWKLQADGFLWISGTRTFSCDFRIVTRFSFVTVAGTGKTVLIALLYIDLIDLQCYQ